VLEAQGAVDAVARDLRAIYEELATCADLRPGPRVDAVFGRLVRLVLAAPPAEAPGVLAHEAVREVADHLRELCFAGEHHLEVAWAERVIASPDPHAELARFPYVDNYRRLGELERDVVRRLADGVSVPAIERVAFVGSGPLPVTSLQLVQETGLHVDNLDRDREALALSRRAADALSVRGLGFHEVDVGPDRDPGVDLAAYDLVVLAALVGSTTSDKARVIRHLAEVMAPGALLLVRSAHGLRTLLYPEVDVAALGDLDVLGVVHPTDEVINSVILARKPHDR
jgi:SAM-dependent methyltransferase